MTTSDYSSQHAPCENSLVRWFWHDAFDEALLRRELGTLRQSGYGGLVLSPPAAPDGYLGQEWMRRVRFVSEVCGKEGLILWLADDWKMPSGSGELARARQENHAWSLRFQFENFSREAAAAWQAPQQKPIAAWAAPREKSKVRWQEAQDLLSDWDENPARGVAAFNEDVQVVAFFAEPSPNAIDRMTPYAARHFVELVHHSYREAVGEFFGTTIRGFWTAGPALAQTAPDELPWSPLLPEAFHVQHGYDLLPRMASLIAPQGDEAVMVRQHFWQTVSTLLNKNWWQPLRDWCDENNLQLALWPRGASGETFNDVTRAYGDLGSAFRVAHRLFVGANDNLLMTRLTASIAALQNHASPLIVWPENFPPQDRVPLLNQLAQHGIGGQIAPPDEPFQPFAAALAAWNAELSRVGQWLSNSRPAGRIGVLLSTRSAWAHYHPKGHRLTRWVWEDYLSATALLDELHFDFMLVEEADVLDATLREGQLLCGRAGIPLDVLVLSGVTTMHWDLWRRLKDFVESGGKVLCLGLLPRWSERGRDEELENSISQTTMLTVADLYEHGPVDIWGAEESSTGFPITRQNEREGRWACYQPALNSDNDDALLRVRQMLKDSLPAPLECQSKSLRFARRETAEGNLLFLFNSGASQELHLRLRATRTSEQSALFRLDSTKDEAENLYVWSSFSENEGGGFGLDLTLAANESLWLEWRPQAQIHLERASFTVENYDGQTARGYATDSPAPRLLLQQAGRFQSLRGERLILPLPLLLADEWQARRLNPNAFRLNNWFQAGAATQGQTSHPAWHSSFDVSGEPHEVSSLTLWAHINQEEARLFLNGETLNKANPPFLNEFAWASLAGTWFSVTPLLAGHNAVDCTLSAAYEMPQVLLVGDFDLSDGESLIAPQSFELSGGSWHEQNLSWFAGEIHYLQTAKAPESWKNCRIWLELSRVREGVALRVNDTFCGTLLAPPWRFEVTNALQIGTANAIHLCIWNTNAPLISSHEPPPAGLLGPARLVAYPLVEMATKGLQ